MESESLFHYSKATIFLEYILPEISLKFNAITETNDPKENKLYLGDLCKLPTYENHLKGLNDKFKLIENTILFETLRKEFKVLCFSSSYHLGKIKIDGFNMPRMWAQYAQNHTGVCIEFDKMALIEKIKNSFSPVYYGNVHYKSNLKCVDINKDKLYCREYLKNFIIKNRKQIFFTKHRDWSTEHEYRFLYCGQNEYVVQLNRLIKGIYLGINFNERYYPMIKYFNRNNKLKIFKIDNSGLNLMKGEYIETV